MKDTADDPQVFFDHLMAMPDIDEPQPRVRTKLPMARASLRRTQQHDDKQGVPVDVLRAHDASVARRTARVFVVLTLVEAEAIGRLWANDPNTQNALAKIRLACQVR